MGIIYSNSQKDCCVCQFWDGPRKINVFRDKVEISRNNDKGVCRNPKCGAFKGKQTLASYSSCLKFEKWDKLK